jgi:2',3'-cyclic-nucleotide 2'-phosphodiesterase (5'-nucleotidase family)
MQENNALAVVDTSTPEIVALLGLGTKNHNIPGNALDASDEDGAINIANWPVNGMYMPDAIDTVDVNGTTYIVTANEGDGREYEIEVAGEDYVQYSDEARVEDLTFDTGVLTPELQAEDQLGRLTITRDYSLTSDPAQVRAVHAAPDTPAVDVAIQDSTATTQTLDNVTFFTASDYLSKPAGDTLVQVISPTGGLVTESVVLSRSFTLQPGKDYTVAVVGLTTTNTLTITAIEDNLTPPLAGNANVRVYHFSPGAPAVDIVNVDTDETLVSDLAFPNASAYNTNIGQTSELFDTTARDYLALGSGSYTISVRAAGTDTDVLTVPDLSLEAGNVYSVFAVGTIPGSFNVITDSQTVAVDMLYSYGARSFTLWGTDGSIAYDSGDEFGQITAGTFPQYFNGEYDEDDLVFTFDNRSDAKGGEPEGIVTGVVGSTPYAFVGLERQGGVMVYDLSDPSDAEFVRYINTTNFQGNLELGTAGNVSPEGLIFIDAADSPTGNPLLVVSYELSGSIQVFELTAGDSEATTLTLLHNNDGESALRTTERTIGPDSGFGNTEEVTLTVGGVASFKTLMDTQVADARSTGNSVLAAYAGDAILPSPVLQCSLDDEQGRFFDAIAQRQMPYSVHSIGNHEFDRGPPVLERFIRAFEINGSLTQPFLAANLDFSAVSSFDDLVDEDGLIFEPITDGRVIGEAAIVTDEGTGQRFGIVGIAPYYLDTISSPGDVDLLASDLDGTADIIQTQVDRLDTNGVTKIIVVSHLQDVREDIAIVPQLSKVDLIVAGGGDELLINSTVPTTTQLLPGEEDSIFADGDYPVQVQDSEGRTVYIVTTSGSYNYLGRLDVEFDASGEVTQVLSDTSYIRRNIPEGPNAADNLSDLGITDAVAQDQDIIDSVITPLEECLAANDEPLLGTAVDINITREDVRSEETNGGNLITDAYLWAYNEYAATNNLPTDGAPVIALQNGGGIRDDFGVSSLPASGSVPGTVSLNDINSALPFGNEITVLEEITPTDLKSIFERASAASVESVSPAALAPAGAFMQVSGISVTYNISNTAQVIEEDGTVTTPGERVVAIELPDGTFIVQDGEVVAGAPNVTIVTNSFTAGGGDNYPWLAAVTGENRTNSLVNNSGVVLDYAQLLIAYWNTFPLTDIGGTEYPTIPAGEYPPEGEDRINITAEADDGGNGGNGGNGDPTNGGRIIFMPLVQQSTGPVR